ncbi:MAG: 30S ribosomal protein S3 [Lentisphaerae bacterium]|nr:30S ribosomal protein S3 [Lentisphaerota bacterium]
MGQKVNPIGFRVAVDHDWRSKWFSGKNEFGNLLAEDQIVRDEVKKRLEGAAISKIVIERYASLGRINIYSARPGVLVSRKGEDLDRLKLDLEKKTGKKYVLEIYEIRDPDANAQLVAENIAQQIERRVQIKRAMKRAEKVAMDMGCDGIKIRCSGRINGAEIARVEWSKQGKVPLHTLRANIDYGFAEANTTAGIIGVKVWICTRDDFQPTRTSTRRRSHATNA